MSAASRRRARRMKATRIAQAEARVAARRERIVPGMGMSVRVYKRKDREALSIMGGGRKQRYKHSSKRTAKIVARREAAYAVMSSELVAATEHLPVRLTKLVMFGSSVPTIGWGSAVDENGTELLWTFRYRYDRAFLEIGTSDDTDDWQPQVEDCHYAASRDDVYDDPYRGWLSNSEGVALLTELFAETTMPAAGELFSERLGNTLDLALGRGGDPNAPTLIRTA